MKILVDTHALIWFAEGDPRLSAESRRLLDDPTGNDLLVSVVSCWEIAVKVSIGKLGVHPSYARFIRTTLRGGGFRLLPVRLKHTVVVASLPLHHRDPFDRMLIAQAISENIPVVSADPAFDAYSIVRVW
jgi:PIN domain nuclease of toxin-antitoxin system